jgi:hypothetical protein
MEKCKELSIMEERDDVEIVCVFFFMAKHVFKAICTFSFGVLSVLK